MSEFGHQKGSTTLDYLYQIILNTGGGSGTPMADVLAELVSINSNTLGTEGACLNILDALVELLSAVETNANVGGFISSNRVTMQRPNNTTLYDAGDVFNDGTAGVKSFSPFKGVGKTGVLLNMTASLTSNQTTKPDLTVVIFSKAPAGVYTDNAACPLSKPDQQYIVALLRLNDWQVVNPAAGGNGMIACEAYARVPEALKNESQTISNDMFFVVLVNNAYTPTAQEILSLNFGISQDA